MSLADDPELLQFFTADELRAHEREQRKDIARMVVQRDKEVGSSLSDLVSKLDVQISNSILMPLGLTIPDEKSASMLARLFAGLLTIQKTRGTVCGSDFEESDSTVFSDAAKLAKIPESAALKLPAEVKQRMRSLCG